MYNQDILIDQWGIHGRKWVQSKCVDDRQLWINNNGMLLVDGFKSAQTTIRY